MRREIFLDTETTGLEHETHRILEVAGIAFVDRKPMENGTFHAYCNPQRAIDADAEKIHGMSAQFLADKPLFGDIAQGLQDFLRGADVFIHNVDFDSKFLDKEFARCNLPPLAEVARSVTCTLKLSRKKNSSFIGIAWIIYVGITELIFPAAPSITPCWTCNYWPKYIIF